MDHPHDDCNMPDLFTVVPTLYWFIFSCVETVMEGKCLWGGGGSKATDRYGIPVQRNLLVVIYADMLVRIVYKL